MVDDDEIGFLGGTTRFDNVALLIRRTLRTQAIISRRSHQRPHRRVFRNVGKLGTISGQGSMSPLIYRVQVCGNGSGGRLSGDGIEPLQTQVVGATF